MTPPETRRSEPHWLLVVAELVAGLAAVGGFSWFASTLLI